MHLAYTGLALDRAGPKREDAEWVSRQRASSRAVFLPHWRCSPIVDATGLPRRLSGDGLPAPADEPVLLGIDGAGHAVFAVELSSVPRADALRATGGAGVIDLHAVGGDLPAEDAALLAFARGLLLFHERERFCPSCGAPTAAARGGTARRCSAQSCRRELFPRLDPAVIVLVLHGEGPGQRCLLARHADNDLGTFSTLAGFAEPGESLEEAVAREVHEEVGIAVHSVSYRCSQPFPFPAQLMVGFHASAATDAIRLDEAELCEARWLTREEARALRAQELRRVQGRFSRARSISSRLVEDWIGPAH
jgi:NAD+ diphosphatase